MSNENLTEMELNDFESWDEAANSPVEEVSEEGNANENEIEDDSSKNQENESEDSNNDSEQGDSESKTSEKQTKEEARENINPELEKLGLTEQDGKVGKIVKIDGKEQFVELNELGNDYSGQKALQRRFNEADRAKKDLELQIEQVNTYINDLGKTLQGSGGVINGLSQIAELVGISPALIQQQAIQELIPVINRLSEMDEDSRMVYFDKIDLDYNKKIMENENARLSASKSKLEAERELNDFRLNQNISKEDFDEITDFLRAEGKEVNKANVEENYNMLRSINKAETALKAFDGKLMNDESILDELVDICQKYPELDHDDLVSILNESFGKAKEENLNNKINNNKKPIKNSKKEKPIEEEEFLDWDEI